MDHVSLCDLGPDSALLPVFAWSGCDGDLLPASTLLCTVDGFSALGDIHAGTRFQIADGAKDFVLAVTLYRLHLYQLVPQHLGRHQWPGTDGEFGLFPNTADQYSDRGVLPA